MLKKIFLLFLFALFLSPDRAQGHPDLKDVVADYLRTLPKPPQPGRSQEETAFNVTQFIFCFLGEKEREKLQGSLGTINASQPLDSLMDYMVFQNYYRTEEGEFKSKDERDQRVSSVYRSVLNALQSGFHLIGYLYGSAFKSAYIFDIQTMKGKVLSRSIDLQERLEYEAYKYIQENLRLLGLNFHFVIIRDDFHVFSLNLQKANEKIFAASPEIKKYGDKVKQIAKEAGIKILNLEDMEDSSGRNFSTYIEENQGKIFKYASSIENKKVAGLKAFLQKEYEYESTSGKEKENHALERAKRYDALKQFVKKKEERFRTESFKNIFGENLSFIPFSIHAEEYIDNCMKIPLRSLSRYKGGCNSQHQLPLLQKTRERYIFYSIRGDILKKHIQKLGPLQISTVGTYQTLLYEGDIDLESLL